MELIDFAGARRIALVGRRDLLDQAARRIGRGGIHLLYYEGGGGIGKTALMEAILERSQRGGEAERLPGLCVAEEVIDFYHVDVHTAEGLIRRICQALGAWSFVKTQEKLAELDQARAAGDMNATKELGQAVQAAFDAEFAAQTEAGVVLAFDTLEVLEYENDPFQEDLGEEMPIPSASEWLLRSFLPALQGNVVILLAGRPSRLKGRLKALHKENPRLLLQTTVLGALTPEETSEYLKAIARLEAKRGDGDAAARLWAFCEERGDVVHLLTGGRPILLALVADMVAYGWTLPPSFGQKLEALQEEGAQAWWPEIERMLVVRIQESPTPMGEALRALAWLRKGATPELLARVMDVKTFEGAWDIYRATGCLDQVAHLALVKVHPGTRRVFLHDEMYALLETHFLQTSSQEERDRVYAAIRDYYRCLTRDLERRIERYPPMLVTSQARLRQAFVEEMHYRICASPPMGFAMYFWLAEEALGGRDSEMDMLLRTEFLRTLGMLEQSANFLGMVPREAQLDVAVRWGMRALFLRSDPESALRIFDRIRKKWGKDAGKLNLGWAHMQLYRAASRIYRAEGDDWQEARQLLARAERTADEVLSAPAETPVVKGRRWRARILKSLVLNYRGYLDRQQGRYLEAVRHYQESAMLQRRLAMAALAPTLTNLSYVMALTGQFNHAHLLAEEAGQLAQRSGRDHMLALTLNVRALVEEYAGHHRDALRFTDQALEVAVRLPAPRVQGLVYLTRARAHRYLWDSFTPSEQERQPEFLVEALKEANQAVNYLRGTPADRVDALLERGCVYRELARMHYLRDRAAEAVKYGAKSRSDLERAAVLAGAIDLPRQQALAWTDLAWLCYYLGELEEVQEALQQAYLPVPEEYFFPTNGPLPPIVAQNRQHEATLPYWSTLGKAEMLKAYLALDQVQAAQDRPDHESKLQLAVRHVTLSLAYDELIAEEYFELTRAEEKLHKRILQDSLSIRRLHQHAKQVAEEQGLHLPTRLQAFLDRMFGTADLWR